MAFLSARARLRRRWAAPVASLVLIMAGTPGRTAELADDVRAAYLFNFIRFVEWPDATKQKPTLTVGVWGDEDFTETLADALHGRRIGDQAIRVQPVLRTSAAIKCDIVYVRGERGDGDLVRAIAGRPVMTITDAGDTDFPAMIRFVEEKGALRFAVDTAAVQQAGLRISSQMLQFAIILNQRGDVEDVPLLAAAGLP